MLYASIDAEAGATPRYEKSNNLHNIHQQI
jgi:hypothetical protein